MGRAGGDEAVSQKREAREARKVQRKEQARQRLRERTQGLLEDGEQIQSVFPAQVGINPWLGFLTLVLVAFNRGVVIAATNRSIVVLDAGSRNSRTPIGIRDTLPRATMLGPVSGGLWSKLNAPPRTYVNRFWHDEVEVADAFVRGDLSSHGGAGTSGP